MKKRYLLLLPLITAFAGCAQSDEANMTLHGRIAMKGHAPHSYLVIEDRSTKKRYKIENAKHFDLANKQNRVVTLNAVLVKEAVGPGFPAVIHVTGIKAQ